MDYKYSVFPGRFQFFHNAHHNLALHGLTISEKLIFTVGSVKRASTIQNPFSFEERVGMISSAFTKDQLKKIHFLPIRDYYYNDHQWLGEVQTKTGEFINYGDSVALIGAYKDEKSSWVNAFPQWKFKPAKNFMNLNATDIRKEIFELGLDPSAVNKGKEGWEKLDPDWWKIVPDPVKNWVNQNFIGSPQHAYLIEEYLSYKKGWDAWANSPYAPTFLTADALVIKSGHILLVKRKFSPGKGLWALPGGFVQGDETIRTAAIRELREETGIRVDAPVLDRHIVMKEEFDYPSRSLRGRTVTTAFKVDLGVGPLPEVKGSDDAEKAFWIPWMDVAENSHKFFEDHFDIINYMITSGSKKEKFV